MQNSLKVFMASSSEGKRETGAFVRALRASFGEFSQSLGCDLDIVEWYGPDSFAPGTTYLSSLLKHCQSADFGVFLFRKDHMLRDFDEWVTRDNVVLELGMFTGQLGAQHVFLLCDEGVKRPSDYDGHSLIPFASKTTTSPEQYLSDAASRVAKRIFDLKSQPVSAPIPPMPPLPTDQMDLGSHHPSDLVRELATIAPKGTSAIVIYRAVKLEDWFSELKKSLEPGEPILNSRMVYFGPGLHKNWPRMTKEGDAYGDILKAFDKGFPPLLGSVLAEARTSPLRIVDLGVGDFEKGRRILEQCAEYDVSYVPVDISYEMIASALDPDRPAISTLLRNHARSDNRTGSHGAAVYGINAPFSLLPNMADLLGPNKRNVFLLLGNTLGNEANELTILDNIREIMAPQDILMVEVQLAEKHDTDEPISANQRHLFFYGGPLTAVGCPPEHLRLEISRESWEDSDRFAIMLRVKKDVTLNHPALPTQSVKLWADTRIRAYLVKKYRGEQAIVNLMRQAKFDVIESRIKPDGDVEGRRFCYLMCTRSS